MRKGAIIIACLLVLEGMLATDGSVAQAPALEKDKLPRTCLPMVKGMTAIRKEGVPISRWAIRKGGDSLSVWGTKSTLEEILEKLAVETKVNLRFYCQDPGLKQERADTKIKADSLENALRQLLSGEHEFTPLNQEGKPTENEKEIVTLNIYSKGCPRTDPPVRIFLSERKHSVLSKAPEEISLEELRAIVKREGPVARAQALDALGKKGDEKAIPVAKEALKDENPRVMLAAANALRRLGLKHGTEKVADAIFQRYREKPYGEFLPILAEVDKIRIWPVIDALMEQGGEREKSFILNALLRTNDKKAVNYLLTLSSGGSESSKQAIYGIARIGGPEAASALIKLLKEGDALQQGFAAQAIHFLPKGDGVEARNEVEKMVKEELTPESFLQALAEVAYLEPFEKILKDSASKSALKIRVLRAATRGGERAIETISLGLSDQSPQVRLAATNALGALVAEGTIPYLIKATQDEDPKIRSSAIRGLAEFPGEDKVAEAIGKLMDDPDQKVRKEAADAFVLLGEPSETMKAILNRCKNHQDPYVANRANFILQRWGLTK